MKLTNYMRDAFIERVMAEVPATDFAQQLRDHILKTVVESLPPAVLKVWKDSTLRSYVNTSTCSVGNIGVGVPSVESGWKDAKLPEAGRAKADELLTAHKAQKDNFEKLRSRLRGVAYGVTTRKALADALPEFEKYLPPDEAASLRSLPVVANVVAEFVKAGWPKDKKPAKAAA